MTAKNPTPETRGSQGLRRDPQTAAASENPDTPNETSLPSIESLNRDTFLRSLIRELSGTLEEVVGLEEASGFVSIVGQRIGDDLNQRYRKAAAEGRREGAEGAGAGSSESLPLLTRGETAQALVDLKRRIQGDFYVVEQTEDRIVLGNRACPFGDKVLGRSSMCMMTSNVFGVIASENLGYAKVELRHTIARGHPECRVIVYLDPESTATREAEGREYFRAS
jgi:hypothetical protein